MCPAAVWEAGKNEGEARVEENEEVDKHADFRELDCHVPTNLFPKGDQTSCIIPDLFGTDPREAFKFCKRFCFVCGTDLVEIYRSMPPCRQGR